MDVKLFEPVPENWTFLEAVVIAKCLDEDGNVQMWHSATEALNSWEALGMTVACGDRLRRGLQSDEDD